MIMKMVEEKLRLNFKDSIVSVEEDMLGHRLFEFKTGDKLKVGNPRIISFNNVFLGFDWYWDNDKNFSRAGFHFGALEIDIEERIELRKSENGSE